MRKQIAAQVFEMMDVDQDGRIDNDESADMAEDGLCVNLNIGGKQTKKKVGLM